MSRKYKFKNNQQLYFITYSVVNWIDLFTRNENKDILLKSWGHCCNKKGLEVYAWVIMTNHIHMIIGSNNASFQLWQQHNQPIVLSTNEMMQQKLDYIHNNPVTAGIVDKAEEYLYSSARDYYSGKNCGLFPVVFIE